MGKRARWLLLALLALFDGSAPLRIEAQTTPPPLVSVRGKVTDSTGTPLGFAIVAIDSAGKLVARPTQTNELGEYVLRYDGTESEPWVAVQMLGYRRQRKQVVRDPLHPSIALLDFALLESRTTLDTRVIIAERSRPARDMYRSVPPGGTEVTLDRSGSSSGRLDGDLTTALGNIPGIVIKTNADGSQTASAFGLGGDQNSSTLNGMDFGGVLPRDGLLQTVRMSTYDPRNGRFGGVQISSTLGSGSVLSIRTGRLSFDVPSLQLLPGGPFAVRRNVQEMIGSGTASGPLVGTRMFWSASAQLQRRTSGLVALGSPRSAAWERTLISADSVQRLRTISQSLGLPLKTGVGTADPATTSGSGIVRVDFTPNAQPLGNTRGDVIYALAAGNWRNTQSVGGNPFSAETRLGQNQSHHGQLLLSYSPYLNAMLSETRVSVSTSEESVAPTVDLPSVSLLLASNPATGGTPTLANLELGGGNATRLYRTQSWEGSSDLSWMSVNGAHRFNLFADARWEHFSLRETATANGLFTFASLAELEQNRPASFMRSLGAQPTSGERLQGVLAFSDLWYVSAAARESHGGSGNGLTAQYGVRLDAEQYRPAPANNPAIESLFGRRNDHLPGAIAIEPMMGFTWNKGVFSLSKGAGGLSETRSKLDGGIRIYRGSVSPLGIDMAARQTGQPTALSTVQCVGSASPTPDWAGYLASTTRVPDRCADGALPQAGGLAAPVLLYSPSFAIPESWRAELKWTWLFTSTLSGHLGVSYANNRHQSSRSNLNFSGVPQFPLANEAGRPVYVMAEGIDSSSGQISSVDSRLAPAYSSVTEIGSAGASLVRGFTTGLTYYIGTSQFPTWEPNPARFHATIHAWYSFADQRELLNGFDGLTARDPRVTAWERGALPRHTFQLAIESRLDRWFDLAFSARIASGIPFTPLVNADVNGDGLANDRAFVFDPSTTADPALRDGLRTLITSAPSGVRRCLTGAVGRVAGMRNCDGAWSASVGTITLAIDPFRIGLGNRGTMTIYVQNALGGIDQLLHGDAHLQGWGDPSLSDPVLLVVRGFDPSSRAFRYAVNPQFGNSEAFRAVVRQPTKISVDFKFQLHRNFESQSIDGVIKYFPGPLTVDALAESFSTDARASGDWDMRGILRNADSLQLSEAQRKQLNQLETRHGAVRDSIYRALAEFLLRQNGEYGTESVRARWHSAIEQSIRATFRDAATVREILTAEQMRWLRVHRLAWPFERSPTWLELTTRGNLPRPR